MTSHMRRRVAALLAALVLAAPAFAQQPVELRLAFPAPGVSPLNSQGFTPWAKDIEAASGGTIAIRVIGGTTLATFETVWDRVAKGVADIGFGVSASVGGQFPKTEVAALPFELDNPREGSLALWRLYQRGLIAEEYNDVKLLGLFTFGHAAIHTRTAKIKSLSDLKGLKLRAGGRLEGDMIAALGGAPITINPADIYQSISNGLIDGAVVQWTAMNSFKIYEVAKNHLRAPLGSSTAFIAMNKRSYDKLPPQAKAAIDKHSYEPLARRMGDVVHKMDDFAQANVAKQPGQVIETIPAEEAARWRKQLQAISEGWVKSTPNGAAILAGFREEIKRARDGK
jgi:TRAP-type C4-dicarboxylate transport system substrate-binding protein